MDKENEEGLYIISVAARLAHVHPQTLRLYERKGLLCPKRTAKNRRRYSDADIERLKRIQELTQDKGLNLSGVQMVLDMDADIIKFPKEFLREAGQRNLLGCRYPKEWGGRDMDWVTTCMIMEEVGMLGYEFACVFGVGAELVCDAIRW